MSKARFSIYLQCRFIVLKHKSFNTTVIFISALPENTIFWKVCFLIRYSKVRFWFCDPIYSGFSLVGNASFTSFLKVNFLSFFVEWFPGGRFFIWRSLNLPKIELHLLMLKKKLVIIFMLIISKHQNIFQEGWMFSKWSCTKSSLYLIIHCPQSQNLVSLQV